MRAELNRATLSVAQFAIKQPTTRYHGMSSVRVSVADGRVLTEATNGKALARASYRAALAEGDNEPGEALVPASLVNKAVKARPRHKPRMGEPKAYDDDHAIQVSLDNQGLALAVGGTLHNGKPAEGNYPDTRAVWPAATTRIAARATIGLPLLELLVKGLKAAGASGVRLEIQEPKKAGEIDTTAGVLWQAIGVDPALTLEGIVMPLSTYGSHDKATGALTQLSQHGQGRPEPEPEPEPDPEPDPFGDLAEAVEGL